MASTTTAAADAAIPASHPFAAHLRDVAARDAADAHRLCGRPTTAPCPRST